MFCLTYYLFFSVFMRLCFEPNSSPKTTSFQNSQNIPIPEFGQNSPKTRPEKRGPKIAPSVPSLALETERHQTRRMHPPNEPESTGSIEIPEEH